MAEINTVIAQNKETASVWRRGLVDVASLDEDEKMQFLMLVGQYTNLWSVMHQLHNNNQLPETQWQVVRNDIASIMKSDGGKFFWKMGGEQAFDEDFAAFINEELATPDMPYDMAEMTR
jgi:hypothetical protein